MTTSHRKARIAFLALLVAVSAHAAPIDLFSDVPMTGALLERQRADLADPTVERARYVRVRIDLLAGAVGPVSLNLFPDRVYVARPERVEPRADGGRLWTGDLAGVEHGRAVLVVRNGRLTGNVSRPGGFFRIRPVDGAVHAIYETDQTGFPECTAGVPVAPPGNDPVPPDSAADDGSTIDVLVVYTSAAGEASADILAEIDLAAAETNDSYSQSGVAQRVRVVRAEEVSYEESGDLRLDLDRVKDGEDGYLDGVPALRDDLCADLVSLWVETGDACGIGFLMDPVGAYFAENGFSVVARSCATGYYSFGHELGHNMGARHDRYVDDAESPFGFAHGYAFPPERWRTIMAYNNACADQGFNCTRIQFWSNADLTYLGDPLGVPEGDPEAADNRKTLNATAATVAAFRDSAACAAPDELIAFEAVVVDDAVNVTWRTAAEPETAGFHVVRSDSEGGLYTRITPSLISPAGAPDRGATYSHLDRDVQPGNTYWYKIEWVKTSGASSFHGPVSATLAGPPPPRWGCAMNAGTRGTADLALLLASLGFAAALRRRAVKRPGRRA